MKLEDLLQKITPLPWSTPHLSRDDQKCNCCYLLSGTLMGSVATVSCAEGANESDNPPVEQAKANGLYLPHASNVFPKVVEALRMLHDLQNGCPLEKYRKQWEEAMRLTESALAASEEVNQ